MEKEGVIITREQHPEIYEWLSENVWNYKSYQKHYTLTSDGKINAYCDVLLYDDVTQIKYPFGCVKGYFDCGNSGYSENSENLISLIGSPKEVGGDFILYRCKNLTSLKGLPKKIKNEFYFTLNNFSNNTKYKEKYKLYLAMWLELFESVSNKERLEYITNYKDKKDYDNDKPIIPVEILKEYGF